MFWKKGLTAAKNLLSWAFTCWPSSQARVTSAKSTSFLRFPKVEFLISLKSFHLRHNLLDIIDFYFRLCKDWFKSNICKIYHKYYKLIFFAGICSAWMFFKGFVSSIIICNLFSLSILQKYLLLLKLLQKCPSPAAPNGYFGEGPNSSIDCLMQGF